MSRLVVVSNRIPIPVPSGQIGELDIPAGGLASALFTALRSRPGSLWVGWNGRIEPRKQLGNVSRFTLRDTELLGIPFTQGEVDDYYHGFCNMVLWPLFHSFQDRARIEDREQEAYRRLQHRLAQTLRPLVRDDDRVWVHDYHLIPLGRELRRLGWRGRLGFFLHIPFPALELWQVLPDPRGFLEALLEYDVIGFQTEGYRDNYLYCCRQELGARWDERHLSFEGRRQRVGVYPVGINADDFAPASGQASGERPRRGVLGKVVRGRRLILGVDRLDYTKGIPDRVRAYERFLKDYPQWKKKVSFIQIAAPSRTAAMQYQEEKRKIEALVGRVNGEMASHDWVPIRYLYKTYPRPELARFYREADVGLVTPLRDGMNLVAMEYAAAQNPESPGVLILSRCAGAARQLPEALIVNPFVPSSVADGLAQALSMPLEERRERHRALLTRIRQHSVSAWGDRFIRDLDGPSRLDSYNHHPAQAVQRSTK
ncbi:MAG TPA: trehalose-6-phosphate synthase [Candidatus Polarisedimenticolia bacterium]|nr:trehalose-6-phosphate synthase [Candidatus Polarisedimenticolia bacterium]